MSARPVNGPEPTCHVELMARKSTIKLLLINESDNEGERLISLFRNAGRVARAQRAASLEDLHSQLASQSWDLLIANDKHREITIEQALEQVKKSGTQTPCIVIADSNATALLESGACDVIASDDDRRLILAAFREIQHLENFRELEEVREKLNDAEERSALLMAQSQDAIAYVSDGMLVNCNPLFAERFGYGCADDLDCVPVIDLIDSRDHEKFKGLLKSQLSSGEGNTDFSFTGLKHSGDSFPANMQLSSAVFDDEPCVQLAIRDSGSTGGNGGGSPDRDYLTDLYSTPYLVAQVDSAIKQAAAGTGNSALLVIAIDGYVELRHRLGISGGSTLLANLAEHLQSQCDPATCLARLGDDSFALLLPDSNGDKAQALAGTLRDSIAGHSVGIGGESIQCTASIGIAVIDGQPNSDANTIIDHSFAAAETAREGSGIELFVPAREKKSLGDAGSDDELDKILEEALEDDRFVLIFQPVVSLRGASGDHYEVQTHMLNEDGSEIDADEFLGSLHFSGINTRLDRWIFLEASKQLSAQIDAGQDTRLFLNLTANALRDDSLIAWLGVALKAGGIPAQAIAFQFQEADIRKHQDAAKDFARAIKEMGCKISIAGFGSGDNPTALLREVAGDFAKVASKYTDALQKGGGTEALKEVVANVVENESQVIVAGVENAAALAQLWQLGVDYIQGSYLAGPSRQMDYEFTDIA